MILKDDFYHLTSSDLVSWWPFLCLAVCCYCLLPRILLFVAGTVGRNRALAGVSFHRAEHKQLLHRLLTPRLETKPVIKEAPIHPEGPVVVPVVETVPEAEEVKPLEEAAADGVNGRVVVLVPDELYADYDEKKFGLLSKQAFGYTTGTSLRIDDEYSDAKMILDHLQEPDCCGSALLILQEAWQPPIQEMLTFLRDLRKKSDEELHIILALIGKPVADTIFTPVTATDLQIWKQKTAILADPCLQVSPLIEI